MKILQEGKDYGFFGLFIKIKGISKMIMLTPFYSYSFHSTHIN
ncbi:hypothetical protein NEOC95_001414 [Neochlamydia sp. AcF95]|nr:hypothetical protein [Neochlamydia sp. AcF95]